MTETNESLTPWETKYENFLNLPTIKETTKSKGIFINIYSGKLDKLQLDFK